MSEQFHPDRLQRLAELRALGADPFASRTPPDRELAAGLVEELDRRGGESVTVAGRVLGRRGYGKLSFLDLHDQSGKIQLCLQKDRLPDSEFALLKALNLGDVVAVQGELGTTQKGEPTVFADHFQLLTKALTPPPEKWHGLHDEELRARLRYVDLFSNPEVRQRFLGRTAMISAMREVFRQHRYTEVETPVLHPIYGGANARPFSTHHNTLDMQLFLRIAPELYLKRLLVGGIERVFEFARVFRNEGISNRHNPEFTMLEFYQAYTDYRGMAELTEELLAAAARAAGCETGGRLRSVFRGQEFDLTPPYPRRRYADLFESALGFHPGQSDKARSTMLEHGMSDPGEPGSPEDSSGYQYWKAVNDLFESKVEPTLDGPVFVTDYPAAICPLAKPSPDDPVWAERWELFVGGMEMANAFTELNDPQLQLLRFEQQVADRDPETPSEIDHDYVRALAYGMPPAGGCGIGIDRLAMVVLGLDTIRDAILFPLLRREVRDQDDDPAEMAAAEGSGGAGSA